MDRREEKTINAIIESFNELLMNKPYASITVKQIIDNANVGRSTFYSHFETKDDLVKYIYNSVFDHIERSMLDKESTHDFSKSNSKKDKITHILYHLKENQGRIKGLALGDTNDYFWNYFKMKLDGFFKLYFLEDFKNKKLPDSLMIHHLSGSFINVIKWWFLDGLKKSPEEITKYFLNIIY